MELLLLETKDTVIYNAYKKALDYIFFGKYERIQYSPTRIWYIADQGLTLEYFYQSLNEFRKVCNKFTKNRCDDIEWLNVVPTHDVEMFCFHLDSESGLYYSIEQQDSNYVKDLDYVDYYYLWSNAYTEFPQEHKGSIRNWLN